MGAFDRQDTDIYGFVLGVLSCLLIEVIVAAPDAYVGFAVGADYYAGTWRAVGSKLDRGDQCRAKGCTTVAYCVFHCFFELFVAVRDAEGK